MADKKRKMSEAEIDAYLKEMHEGLSKHLDAMQQIVPPGYVLTFVARHPDVPGGHMILTKDADLEAVADCILDNKGRVVVEGDKHGKA